MVNISNLPKSMQALPKVRGASLRVYRTGPDTFRVPGGSKIYDLRLSADGKRIICDCAAAVAAARCAHRWAVHYFLVQERKDRSNITHKKEVHHG